MNSVFPHESVWAGSWILLRYDSYTFDFFFMKKWGQKFPHSSLVKALHNWSSWKHCLHLLTPPLKSFILHLYPTSEHSKIYHLIGCMVKFPELFSVFIVIFSTINCCVFHETLPFVFATPHSLVVCWFSTWSFLEKSLFLSSLWMLGFPTALSWPLFATYTAVCKIETPGSLFSALFFPLRSRSSQAVWTALDDVVCKPPWHSKFDMLKTKLIIFHPFYSLL